MPEPPEIDVTLPAPTSVEETGLSESLLEGLILKTLYFGGELYGKDLADHMGLRFSVIDPLLERLKLQHDVQVKRSLGMGNVSALLFLTQAGGEHALQHADNNRYWGRVPVPVSQYARVVPQFRLDHGWLTPAMLAEAYKGLVLAPRVLNSIGPALSSFKSMLLYGKPGDGKTYMIESLVNLKTSPIYVPHALESQGNIIQLFDPIYHEELPETADPECFSQTPGFDRRWRRCKRPFIITGGELSMDMLDLRLNESSKVYEAPFQLKANNGIYLIDDFGRQRAAPAEVLNRWIVPMERHVDYLSFVTGGKMTVPFETFLVFSTNLNPSDLGDEAFLRRIQYKLRLAGPAESEFTEIFARVCAAKDLQCPRSLVQRLVDDHYRATGRPFRRCHPRDIIQHALDFIDFESLPSELTPELLNRAVDSCFVEDAAPPERFRQPVRAESLIPMCAGPELPS